MTKAVPFIDRALTAMSEGLYNDHKTVTGEQVRYWLKSKRVKAPTNPNLYGSLISKAISIGFLNPTNKTALTESGKQRTVYNVSKKKIELA
jgi:hypothetical protein